MLGAYPRQGLRGSWRGLTAEGAAQLDAVLRLFPRLRERHGQLAGTLSGGEQQMLAIGRGLMSWPRLLLLDEPSLGLAPRAVAEIVGALLTLREQGTTIVLVEQNVRAALACADYIYWLEHGTVAREGRPAELEAAAEWAVRLAGAPLDRRGA